MNLLLYSIFYLSLFVQAFFLVFIFLPLAFYKDKRPKKSYESKVSIVICAHNEIENLKKLIPALLEQNYKNFEIILVDDRSEDETFEFFRCFSEKKIIIVRIVQTPWNYNSKKFALEQGILKSSGDVILVTDADCFPASTEWIYKMQSKVYGEKQLVLGYSPYIKKPGILNLFIRYETFFTAIQYFSLALRQLPYMGVGRNMLYTKSLYQQKEGLKGYHNVTGGDDDLFVQKAANSGNTSIQIDRAAHMFSVPHSTLKGYFRQKLRHLSVGKYYNLKSRAILGLLIVSQIFFYLSLMIMAISGTLEQDIIVAFVFRTLLLIIIFAAIGKKLNEDFNWLLFPVLDFLYMVNYISVALSTTVSKNIKWN